MYLCMLDFAFQGIKQGAFLIENSDVEIVVIVEDNNLAKGIDTNANWIVSNTLATNLAQEFTTVVEDLKIWINLLLYF